MPKRSQYIDSLDWLKTRLPFLAKPTKTLFSENMQYSDSKNGPWSVIKELFLAYYAPTYHDILRSQGYELYYIDLFSGPGFQRINEFETTFPGSPITITKCLRDTVKFDQLFFSDLDDNYINQLKTLLSDHSSNHFYKGEVNDNVESIVSDVESTIIPGKKVHALVFIDPYAMQLDWASLKTITEAKFGSDLIITLMTEKVLRVIRAARSSGRSAAGDAKKLDKFFGCSDWQTIDTEDEVQALYIRQLASINRDESEEVIIYKNDKKKESYRMIVAVKGREEIKEKILNIVNSFRKQSDKLNGYVIKNAVRHYFDTPGKRIDSWGD